MATLQKPMQYQLVLQWPTSSVDDYEAMIAIEDALIASLPDDSEVDGHDAGSGQMNIFIRTDNPAKTFEDTKNILGSISHLSDVRAAYCNIEANTYTIIWPNDLNYFDVS